jgi:hypothetical protein
MLVLNEYSSIMINIQEYLFKDKDEKLVKLRQTLIRNLNSRWMSCLYLALLHLSVLTFNEASI